MLPSYRRFTARQFVWKEKGGKQIVFLLIAFLAICASYYLKGFTLESYYDTPERVQTILFTGQLSGFNALTGAADDLPLRGNVLPVLYACLCRGFSLTPAQLLLQYLPPFLLLLIFLEMAALFTVLPVKNENLSLYLLFFALATICGASAYMNTSYGVLFAVYEGSVLSDHLVLCLLPVFVYGTGKTGKQKGIAGVMLLLLLVLSYVLGGRESLLVGVTALLLLFLVKIFLFLTDRVADRKKDEKGGMPDGYHAVFYEAGRQILGAVSGCVISAVYFSVCTEKTGGWQMACVIRVSDLSCFLPARWRTDCLQTMVVWKKPTIRSVISSLSCLFFVWLWRLPGRRSECTERKYCRCLNWEW